MTVHPHVRGEYDLLVPEEDVEDGSSPRAWGILSAIDLSSESLRFIPTCVGNTPSLFAGSCVYPVHPHVRGEYSAFHGCTGQTRGSSPRAWGIPWILAYSNDKYRFIPTCVGNTANSVVISPPAAVHPHVRGEYDAVRRHMVHGLGSSPRAWGIRYVWSAAMQLDGFIPTCVGNTVRGEGSMPSSWVHPHVRGEYFSRRRFIRSDNGSSPRAWGIRVERDLWLRGIRFIPTCVGNTIILPINLYMYTVHPHVRGEYTRSRIR